MLAAPFAAESGRRVDASPASRGPTPAPADHAAHGPVTGLRPSAVLAVRDAVRSPGLPLDGATRAAMEQGFGHDFGGVRIHTAEPAQRSADALRADAYVTGEHVVFARDRYRPAQAGGRRLIAHELAHVVQQRSRASSGGLAERSLEQDADHPLLELEAERAALDVEAGHPVTIGAHAILGVQRQAAGTVESTQPQSTATAQGPQQSAATPVNQAAPPPAPAVAPEVQAAQAGAAEGMRRLAQTVSALLASKDQTERNTGGLFSGATPRIAYTTMTLRTDSEQIRVKKNLAPGTVAYYFVGPTQVPWDHTETVPAGTLPFGPDTLGTTDDDVGPPKIVVRVKGPDGAWRSEQDLKTTFVHESSHILVKSYGELPQTGPHADSFDRYADEFRAYWVADFARLPEADRWQRIREHLVGQNSTGYPDLRDRYWAKDAAGNWTNAAFRAQVDGYHRPVGYNQTNSPGLDRLFKALGEAKSDPGKTDAAILAILQLTPAERAEANSASLISNLVAQLTPGPAARVRDALSTPTNPDYSSQIDAVKSQRVTAFLTACALNQEAGIKAAYAALDGSEKSRISMNAAVDVFLDHHLPNVKQRAAVYAMVVSKAIDQYDVMNDFLTECLDTLNNSISTTPAGPTPRMMELLKRLTLNSRLSLYALNKGARIVFVDPLPEPVLKTVGPIVRGDRDA